MLILSNLKEVPTRLKQKNAVITVGVFDGVHRGHQRILQKTFTQTRRYPHAQSVVITFREHPLSILAPSSSPPLLLSNTEKLNRINRFGIDIIINQHFTKHFANLTATEFVTSILCRSFQIKEIIVGHDHGFGKHASGDVRLLEKLGQKLGFRVTVVDPVCYHNIPISSTRIREMLAAGKVRDAAIMLGQPHQIIGKVVKGDRRGTTLGFPTANIVTEHELVPGNGIYAVLVTIDETRKKYPGMMSIGFRPTFCQFTERSTIEIHLFNYSGNLYHRKLKVHFIARLRDEQRFPNAAALVAQIKKDESKARKILRYDYKD